MSMVTVPASSADESVLRDVDSFANSLPFGSARDALEAAVKNLRAGADVMVVSADEMLTTTQAARILGVSRPHLYKVLDSGALPYSVVGARDRRVAMSDLKNYRDRAEALRREAAIAAAHAQEIEDLALDEM